MKAAVRHDETLGVAARRDHGVHYTPAEMAAEVVAHTLDRIFVEHAPTSSFIRSLRVGDMAMGDGVFLVETCRYLASLLEQAWKREGFEPHAPSVARFVIADECLFGVELDPVAVEKARAALVEFVGEGVAADYEATLVHGDALVGLNFQQLAALDWEEGAPEIAPGLVSSHENRELAGDAVIGAFFAHEKNAARRKELAARQAVLVPFLREGAGREQVESWSRELRARTPALHWPERFPWLFGRWDAMPSRVSAFVGNPPFVGGGRISGIHGKAYLDWLHMAYPGTSGAVDLCAYFFRRAWQLMGRGAMGLIATKTISQGDTRAGGLKHIVDDGGRIFRAHVMECWPGEASVMTSTVFISKHGLAPDEGCVMRGGAA